MPSDTERRRVVQSDGLLVEMILQLFIGGKNNIRSGLDDGPRSHAVPTAIWLMTSLHTAALAQKDEALFKVRQDEPEAVVDAADAPILVHDAASPLSAQQSGDGGHVDGGVKRHHHHQVRRTVPGAQASFLCQDLGREAVGLFLPAPLRDLAERRRRSIV